MDGMHTLTAGTAAASPTSNAQRKSAPHCATVPHCAMAVAEENACVVNRNQPSLQVCCAQVNEIDLHCMYMPCSSTVATG